MEEGCQENGMKGRKRKHKDRSSSVSPVASSPEVKVQRVEGELELANEDTMEVESGCGLPMDGYWAHYQSLCLALPGRERQIEQILTLFGKVVGNHGNCNVLTLFGHNCRGVPRLCPPLSISMATLVQGRLIHCGLWLIL